jgi:hypothetical protein
MIRVRLPADLVRIKIGFNEVELRKKIKLASGKWSKTTKAWQLPYKKAVQLSVKSRILEAGESIGLILKHITVDTFFVYSCR